MVEAVGAGKAAGDAAATATLVDAVAVRHVHPGHRYRLCHLYLRAASAV